ncbi:hypothetical protein LS70_008655 [Helicobacter sp. MIT 11-5569]|uniref:YopX family protein n=1 Tax=Helicobacter sp. MIT 11-5569 TaxID=1548151 RepID=UPI0010FD7A7E|nr:YopX family protein [Helicobacter sp. MIT 11-5569]TLD80739.1 hypothetical protein LS70_008655 [Helicobacter sp. MIT 11-5569]
MLVKDFEFRIVPKPNEKGEYCNCNNADCPARKFHFIVGNEAKSRLSEEELQDCEIELCTGKVDENNKKIFEGDILITKNGDKVRVALDSERKFIVINIENEDDDEDFSWINTESCEVIGNIHETEQH